MPLNSRATSGEPLFHRVAASSKIAAPDRSKRLRCRMSRTLMVRGDSKRGKEGLFLSHRGRSEVRRRVERNELRLDLASLNSELTISRHLGRDLPHFYVVWQP